MDTGLRDQIKSLAAAEGRTESGFVRFYLARLVDGPSEVNFRGIHSPSANNEPPKPMAKAKGKGKGGGKKGC